MAGSWLNVKRYSYLGIESGVIAVPVSALLFSQYQSIRKTREKAKAGLEANLKLRLFEISEDAKRDRYLQTQNIQSRFTALVIG